MRGYLLSCAAGAALLACKASDLAQAGGLSSDNPQTADETQQPETQTSETQAEPQPAQTEAAPTETAAPETQQPAPEKTPEPKPAAKGKTSAKAKAKPEPQPDVGDTVAAALSDGFHAVVWCGAGHEQFRPQDIVMVQDEAYKALRTKGHARDAEESELAAAIKAGKTIHWH